MKISDSFLKALIGVTWLGVALAALVGLLMALSFIAAFWKVLAALLVLIILWQGIARIGESTPSKMATSLGDGGHVVIVRDPVAGGQGASLRLSIDGQAVADLEPTDRYEVFLPDGEYILSIVPVQNRLSQFTEIETDVTVKNGQTYRFRAGYAPSNFFLERTAP